MRAPRRSGQTSLSGSTPYAATGFDEPEPCGHSDLDSRVLTAAGQSRTCTGFPHGVQVVLTLSHAIVAAPRDARQDGRGVKCGQERGTAGRVPPSTDVVLLPRERVGAVQDLAVPGPPELRARRQRLSLIHISEPT